jgi:hypothetical protein
MRVANAFTFETDDALWTDARAGGLFYWATFAPKKLGGGSLYLMGLRDSTGQLLAAPQHTGCTFPPVCRQGSLVGYFESKAFACVGPCETATNVVELSSFDKLVMKQNSDGSVDLYFGPKAPSGFQRNWIPTGRQTLLPYLPPLWPGESAFRQVLEATGSREGSISLARANLKASYFLLWHVAAMTYRGHQVRC